MRYPVFAKSKSSGEIMLFVSRDEAVIIRFKRSELVNGNRIEDGWIPVTHQSAWQILSHEEVQKIFNND